MRLHTSEAKFQESIALALTNGDLVAAAELEHIRAVCTAHEVSLETLVGVQRSGCLATAAKDPAFSGRFSWDLAYPVLKAFVTFINFCEYETPPLRDRPNQHAIEPSHDVEQALFHSYLYMAFKYYEVKLGPEIALPRFIGVMTKHYAEAIDLRKEIVKVLANKAGEVRGNNLLLQQIHDHTQLKQDLDALIAPVHTEQTGLFFNLNAIQIAECGAIMPPLPPQTSLHPTMFTPPPPPPPPSPPPLDRKAIDEPLFTAVAPELSLSRAGRSTMRSLSRRQPNISAKPMGQKPSSHHSDLSTLSSEEHKTSDVSSKPAGQLRLPSFV